MIIYLLKTTHTLELTLKDGASLIQWYFCEGYDYGGKADLSKGYWNLKRKMWVAIHFSEII